MTKRLNVLSIDFTFFQNANADTLQHCYPEGKDLTTEMSEIVWASYYTMPTTAARLKAVTIDSDAVKKIKEIIGKCKNDIPVMITNNQSEIYKFIRSQMILYGLYKLQLTNIDMYHDMFNDNIEIDSGNWIKFLKDDFDMNLIWIGKPESKQMYGLNDSDFDRIATNFDSIVPENIDMIFLCRSDTLFPPHLDEYFDDVEKFTSSKYPDARIDKNVETPRDIDELVKCEKLIQKKNNESASV